MSKKAKSQVPTKPPANNLKIAAAFTQAGASISVNRSFGSYWFTGTISEGQCTQWFRYDATRAILDLQRISTPEAARGQGHANRLFQRIFALADATGSTITTRALTQAPRSFSQNNLLAWYERIGLVVVGRYPAGAVSLQRLPKTAVSTEHAA